MARGRKPGWTVYAWASRPIFVLRTREGPVLTHYYLRVFYNRESAMEQARWCLEAWPDARCSVDRRPFDALGIVMQWHDHPRLPCGCALSLPPCSLEHAVRVRA